MQNLKTHSHMHREKIITSEIRNHSNTHPPTHTPYQMSKQMRGTVG